MPKIVSGGFLVRANRCACRRNRVRCRQSLRSSAFWVVVQREILVPRGRSRQPRFIRRKAITACIRHRLAFALLARAQRRHARNLREKRAFLFSRCVREATTVGDAGVDAGDAAHAPATRTVRHCKFFFAKQLTPEKSVIRFRPSRTFLRKQVSRVIATERTIKRPAARTLTKQYAGFASPEETCNPIQTNTRSIPAAGVCTFTGAAFPASKNPSRRALRVRRLPPGPTPAACFATGL
ncbi:MAG: hypothetical protein QM769_01410 [Pseudoxanthomonas sp.]